MALAIDTSRPFRTRPELRRLVSAILESNPQEQEAAWLEWKSHLDLSTRASRAPLAKGILGFANRDPAAALRFAVGLAYFVVGVEPQSLRGVEVLDSAKLEDQITVYTGQGPRWSPDYVEVDGKSVLVITVEAPEAGDPPFPVRKTLQPDGPGTSFTDGTLFVRRGAKTEHASSSDVDMLARRCVRTQEGRRMDVDVSILRPRHGLSRFTQADDAIDQYLGVREDELLGTLPEAPPSGPLFDASRLIAGAAAGPSTRSIDRYRDRVAIYLAKLEEHVRASLPARALERDVGKVSLGISNATSAAYTGVKVTVELDPAGVVGVYDYRGALPLDDEPKAPPEYRRSNDAFSLPGIHLPGYRMRPIRSLRSPDAEFSADRWVVTFPPVDVRPGATERLPSVWVLLDDDAPRGLDLRWSAAGLDATDQSAGKFMLGVSGEVVPIADLMGPSPED